MLKKGKNKIILSPMLEKIIHNFCMANNRDVKEFLEEAVAEKIEYEELNKDTLLYETTENHDRGELRVEELTDDGFKRKH